ncbi:MAG: glycosyltransferase [Planctomycetota bacterium]
MRRTAHIAHYLNTLDPATGGIVAHVSDLAVLTAAAGWRVDIITPQPEPRPKNIDDHDNIAIHAAPVPAYRATMSKRQLEAVIALTADADLIHLHGAWYTPTIQLASRLRSINRPYVVTPHGMLDDWCMSQKRIKKQLFLRLAGQRFLAGAERLFYCAEAERDQSHRWANERPSSVIPAAMDLSPFASLPGPDLARSSIDGVPNEGDFALFLSRIDPKKGAETLIAAGAELKRRGRELPIVIAGTGQADYVAALERQAESAGIAEQVRFIGLVRDRLKVSLLQAASVLALPTHQENFGLVLTEALAAQTPVITTRGVDIWPTIERDKAGLIAERTPTAFADAIAALLDSPQRRDDMGQRGREWVLREMSTESLTTQFISAYSETLDTLDRG